MALAVITNKLIPVKKNQGMNSKLELEYKKKFASCLENKNYDLFLELELTFYNSFVKKIETPDHYNYCYEILNPFEELYGNVILDALNLKKENRKLGVNKVCYFLPSLDNDLAHIELLESILRNHKPNSNTQIFIAGYSSCAEIKSALLKKLHIENNITILNIPCNHSALLNLMQYIFNESFSKFIVYSIPLHLYAFLNIFGSTDLKWITTRFELNCFNKLKNLISFNYSNKTLESKNKNWERIPASLPSEYRFIFTGIQNKENYRLLTIGRESKICDSVFLDSVKSILLNNQNVSLAIGGFSESSFLEKFFCGHNLTSRVSYLGWVNPKDCINKFDFYLDTPQSGLIAASAFAAGIPTITFRNSNSFVESFEDNISVLLNEKNIENISINIILSLNRESYVSNTTKLINNFELRRNLVELQILIGNRFFYNSLNSYNQFISASLS